MSAHLSGAVEDAGGAIELCGRETSKTEVVCLDCCLQLVHETGEVTQVLQREEEVGGDIFEVLDEAVHGEQAAAAEINKLDRRRYRAELHRERLDADTRTGYLEMKTRRCLPSPGH